MLTWQPVCRNGLFSLIRFLFFFSIVDLLEIFTPSSDNFLSPKHNLIALLLDTDLSVFILIEYPHFPGSIGHIVHKPWLDEPIPKLGIKLIILLIISQFFLELFIIQSPLFLFGSLFTLPQSSIPTPIILTEERDRLLELSQLSDYLCLWQRRCLLN